MSPQNKLSHALYVLNFLNCDAEGRTAAERHQASSTTASAGLARWKDLQTGRWFGPDPVMMWGRGCVCVFPEGAVQPIWVPEQYVRHHNGHKEAPCPSVQETESCPDDSKEEAKENRGYTKGGGADMGKLPATLGPCETPDSELEFSSYRGLLVSMQ